MGAEGCHDIVVVVVPVVPVVFRDRPHWVQSGAFQPVVFDRFWTDALLLVMMVCPSPHCAVVDGFPMMSLGTPSSLARVEQRTLSQGGHAPVQESPFHR